MQRPLQSRGVPELPDLAVVVDAFHAALCGRAIVRAEAPGPLSLRGTPAELAALVGQQLTGVRRRGKFVLRARPRPGRGQCDAHSAIPARDARYEAADQHRHDPRLRRRASVARRTQRAGHAEPRGCRPDGDPIEVRYGTRARWARSTWSRPGSSGHVPGLEADQGPDATTRQLTLDVWRERIRKHPGELKALLRNQAFVAGIGNAYSDEILHAARLSPFRKRASLAPEEIDALYEATRATLATAVRRPRSGCPRPSRLRFVTSWRSISARANRARAAERASAR